MSSAETNDMSFNYLDFRYYCGDQKIWKNNFSL